MSESKDQNEDKKWKAVSQKIIETRHGDFKFAWGFDGEETRVVILVDANLR